MNNYYKSYRSSKNLVKQQALKKNLSVGDSGMLMLNRKNGQRVFIYVDGIKIAVTAFLDKVDNQMSLGFSAPSEVVILREEIAIHRLKADNV